METLEMMPIRSRITSLLKKAIYAGEYKAGEELSLTKVAEQLGVSRTPVREAFQSLEAEGLITLRMNKGAIVNTIDEKFIRDNFYMRELLESEAARLAAQNDMETEALLERLRKISQKETMDKEEYERLNQDIHMQIWKSADNRKLTGYLMELWNGPSTGHSMPEKQAHYRISTEEHMAILQCIAARDAEGAGAQMRAHILRSRDNVLNAMQQMNNSME